MDKAKAMERLDAIEAEAKELRKIIMGTQPQKYDCRKLYVATRDEEDGGALLVGLDSARYFRWHSFDHCLTETAWGKPLATGQKALEDIAKKGFEIREFSDTREAFKYFLDNYKG